MSRQIKFRAWDTKKKTWVLGTNEMAFNIIGEVTVFDMLKGYSLEAFNDIEIMQFTGLKDKNGNGVFEGDIITAMNDRKFIKGEIVWGKCSWLIQSRTDEGAIRNTRLSGFREYEILGNIYENPELLSPQ